VQLMWWWRDWVRLAETDEAWEEVENLRSFQVTTVLAHQQQVTTVLAHQHHEKPDLTCHLARLDSSRQLERQDSNPRFQRRRLDYLAAVCACLAMGDVGSECLGVCEPKVGENDPLIHYFLVALQGDG